MQYYTTCKMSFSFGMHRAILSGQDNPILPAWVANLRAGIWLFVQYRRVNNVIMPVLCFLSLLPCFPLDAHSLEVEAEKDTYFLTWESRWTEWYTVWPLHML